MNHIDVRRFGLAVGTTLALLYLGCMFVMATTGQATTVQFFNNLLHGLDVTSIIRTEVPLWSAFMGLVQIFILGWLSGSAVAAVYNISLKRGP